MACARSWAVGPGAIQLLTLLTLIGSLCAPATSFADPVTIYDLQFSSAATEWQSPFVGQRVSLAGGVVTHIAGFRITIQDPTLGDAWAATEIRAFENEDPLRDLTVGDRVDFYNILVEEFRGGTISQFMSDSSFELISRGNPLPEAVLVDAADLAHPPDREKCEKYEAMLIAVEDVRIGRMDWGKADDNYEILHGSSSLWASDYINLDLAMPPFPTYYVQAGERYSRIQGIYQEYWYPEDGWNYYQLLPRGFGDYEKSNLFTIRDVQESSPADDWASPLIGLRLNLQGTVSAVSDGDCRLSISDRLLGNQWSGIQIDDAFGELANLMVGDDVLLTNVHVTEEDGHSLLIYEQDSAFQSLGPGNRVVAIRVAPEKIAISASPDLAEPYEGMILAVHNAEVISCSVPEGDELYYISAADQLILCSDACSSLQPAGSDFFVREGDYLGKITGVLVQQSVLGGSAYVLHPRSADDYHFTAEGKIYSSWGQIKLNYR